MNPYKDKYLKTKKGLLQTILGSQKANSERRGHLPPNYTLSAFRDRYINDPDFIRIYDDWVKSGYAKMMSPSFDRKDDSKGYSFENLNRWMTWQENFDKSREDAKKGILQMGKPRKSIIGIHIETREVVEFDSLSNAGRCLGIEISRISKCCVGKYKSAGGYAWSFTQ